MTAPFVPPVRPDVTDTQTGSWLTAQMQMAKNGITDEQRAKAYKPRISEALYDQISPMNYQGHGLQILRAIGQMVAGGGSPPTITPYGVVQDRVGDQAFAEKGSHSSTSREDSWRLFLGLPQQNNTFGVSPYKPAHAKDSNTTYFRLNGLQNYVTESGGHVPPELYEKGMKAKVTGKPQVISEETLGHATVGYGKDEVGPYISLYDIWDLDKPAANNIGHPYEVYDRLYLNKDGSVMPDSEVQWKKAGLDDSHKTALAEYLKTLGLTQR